MILDPQQIPKREKLILAGLFLSKFDKIGLRLLGLETFTEAFNVIGFALGGSLRPSRTIGMSSIPCSQTRERDGINAQLALIVPKS